MSNLEIEATQHANEVWKQYDGIDFADSWTMAYEDYLDKINFIDNGTLKDSTTDKE